METECLLRVRLTPRGGMNALDRFEHGVLYVRVTSAPVDGAANRSLIGFLSVQLGIPKSHIAFHSGEIARDKVLRLTGIDQSEANNRIRAALSGVRVRRTSRQE